MNIVLIGYRGTGKSTVGQILAERLSRKIVSTDAEITRRTNRSIPAIVSESGWEHFRDLESEVCRDLVTGDGLVIDTGGGVVLRSENVAVLKKHGVLFWLTAEVPVIAERIGGDDQRPSLTGARSFLEEIEEVLRQREPKYRHAADHVIETDHRTPVEVADAIVGVLRKAELLI
jgi:shikimate kinase